MTDTLPSLESEPVDDRRNTRRWSVAILVSAVAVLGIGLWVGATRGGEEGGTGGVAVPIDPPLPMPAATLTDTDGRPYDLRAETAGKVTLLFFGYTSCPDACPIQMKVLGDVMSTLEPEVRDRLEVIFVTTDPDRDTPAAMRAYLDQFDPTFVGLTGGDEQLVDLQVAAGLPVAVAEPAGDDGGYLVGHATQVLAFDTAGVATEMFPLGVRQADWARVLPELVEDSR